MKLKIISNFLILASLMGCIVQPDNEAQAPASLKEEPQEPKIERESLTVEPMVIIDQDTITLMDTIIVLDTVTIIDSTKIPPDTIYQIQKVIVLDTIRDTLQLNPIVENTRELCLDNIDNDGDELMDCKDPDCGVMFFCRE